MRKILIVVIISLFIPKIITAKKTIQYIILPDFYTELNCQQKLVDNKFIIKALCDSEIKELLMEYQHHMKCEKWSVNQYTDTEKEEIIVKIKSKGIIPSAYCIVKLYQSGDIFFKKCASNK